MSKKKNSIIIGVITTALVLGSFIIFSQEKLFSENRIDEMYLQPNAEFNLAVGYGEWIGYAHLAEQPSDVNIDKLLKFGSVHLALEDADELREIKFDYGLITPGMEVNVTEGLEILSTFEEIFPEKTTEVGGGPSYVIYEGKPYVISISFCPDGCDLRLRR